jgi:hypothetical protein
MKIAYGPPGETGVKQLQYVGDDADYLATGIGALARPIGLIALGVLIYARTAKKKKLEKPALGVALGALVVELVAKP